MKDIESNVGGEIQPMPHPEAGRAALRGDMLDQDDQRELEASLLAAPFARLARRRIATGTGYGQAIDALLDAGFSVAASSERSMTPWPEGLDPMGPPPAPDPAFEIRHFALLIHPDGIVATANSYQKGKGSSRKHMLNALTLHYQSDFGFDMERARQIDYGSRSVRRMRDGTARFDGSEDVVNGRTPLQWVLADCCVGGALLPFESWGPSFIHIDPQLYSAAPHSSMSSERDAIESRFGERLRRDWGSFLATLPAPMRFAAGGQWREAPPPGESGEAGRSRDACSRLAELALAAGRRRPTPADARLCSAWSEAIDAFASQGAELPPLSLGERFEGANFLHALAATRFGPDEAKRLEAWLGDQDPDTLLAASREADAFGRSPAALAFAQVLSGHSEGSPHGFAMADILHARGLIGKPGSLGTAAFAQMELSRGSFLGRGGRAAFAAEAAAIGAARIFAVAERKSAACGVDWLVPMATSAGMVTDRNQALALLTRRFPAFTGERLPLFESMALSIAASKIGATPSAKPMRL